MPTANSSTVKRYVSAVSDIDQREIFPHVIGIQNNYGLVDVMNAFGRYKPSKTLNPISFTDEALWKEGVVESVTGSGSATVSIVLTEATSGGRRKNDIILFKNLKNAIVTSVTTNSNKDTVVATSVDGTNLTVTAADKIKFQTNAVGERSVDRQNLTYLPTRYEQNIQGFRESDSTSDLQSLAYVEAPEGRYSFRAWADKFLKLKAEVNAAMISMNISAGKFTSASNMLTDPEGGGATQTMRGLHQYIDMWGITDTVASAGTITLTGDISDMIDKCIANKSGPNYNLFGSSGPLGKLDDHLKGLGNAGVNSARMNMDGKEINFTVERLDYKGFRLQKYLLPILNQPELFGGTTFAKGIYWAPEGKTKVADNSGSSSWEPFVQIRYIPQPRTKANAGNDIFAEIHSGAYSPVNPNGSRAEANVSWLTFQAIEVLGAQHFGFQTVLS